MQNLRVVYDRNGKSMVDKEGPSMEDAAGFFAQVFGGEQFMAYVSRTLVHGPTDIHIRTQLFRSEKYL